jgi:hypothetical protein
MSNDAMTVNALFRDPLASAEDPTKIGSSGKMHGAKIVSIPAINEMRINWISTKMKLSY